MKYLCLILGLLLVAMGLLSSQNTFNRRIHLNSPAAIATGVIATDTCYYVMGIVADTLYPYKSGNFFLKLDFNGEVVFDKWLVDSVRTYQTWRPSFQPFGTGFINTGYSTGGEDINMVVEYTSDGNVAQITTFQYFFDEFIFSAPRAMAVIEPKHQILVASEQENPEGINNGDIVLTLLDSNHEILWKGLTGISSLNRFVKL